MNNRWIAYVGPFDFPWGSAASRRVYGNAKALAEYGYNVVVVGAGAVSDVEVLEGFPEHETTISYCNVNEFRRGELSNALRALCYLFLFGRRTVSWLDSRGSRPACVILYGGLSSYALNIKAWCKANNVPFVVDVVEWYDGRQLLGGRFGPFYASSNIALRYIYPHADGVIAISKYLEDYYKKFTSVVRVPPIAEKHVGEKKAENLELSLVYAGNPGKKDQLGVIIDAVEEIASRGMLIRLDILGVDEQYIKNKFPSKGGFSSSIVPHGRVSQEEVYRHLVNADFSVLIRESEKFTNAGFPTKFSESLACGVPVIANITSDIGSYLLDDYNGYIVPSCDKSALVKLLYKVIELKPSEKRRLRRNARETAERFFSSAAYRGSLGGFVDGVVYKNRKI